MNIFHPANLNDHQLLDSGRGQKLERFSGRLISRPEPNAVWERKLDDSAWRKADARFVNGNWELNNWADKPWINDHMLFIIKPDIAKGNIQKVSDRVRLSSSYYIVIRTVRL